MAEQKIRVVVKGGVAEVDEKTVPEGIEVVIIDLDVLVDEPGQFTDMPLEDQQYMETEYPEIMASVKEAAGLLVDELDEDETGDDLCDLCSTSKVHADRTTYCGKTIGNECGCNDSHADGTCGDPSCDVCKSHKQEDANVA